MGALRIDVWSDIACPWCWVGKRKLEGALERFPERDRVEVVYHAFELDPAAPRVRDPAEGSNVERLARKYRVSVAQAQAMVDRMTAVGAEAGVAMRFDQLRPGNTFDAHRLLALAKARGLQAALKERLFRAYLGEGEAIGEPEVLSRLAAEVGLERGEVEAALLGDDHRLEVRRDEAEAAELGITGVPFFVFGDKYAVSGAQPEETLLHVLRRAWEELVEAPEEPLAEEPAQGATCGPEGCA